MSVKIKNCLRFIWLRVWVTFHSEVKQISRASYQRHEIIFLNSS